MCYVKVYLNGWALPTVIDCLPYSEAIELAADIPGAFVEPISTDAEIDRACECEVNRGV